MAENNPAQFGVDAFTEEGLKEIVEMLAKLRKEPLGLANIKKYSESCARWGGILAELLENPRNLFVRGPGRQVPFAKIAQELRTGRAVLISTKIPNPSRAADHFFTLEPQTNGEVRVIHAWQDMHTLRAEDPMPIEELMPLLEILQLELTKETQKY